MKKIVSIFLILLFLAPAFLKSRLRYKNEIFNDVIKTEDVIYGNAPDIPFNFAFEWFTENIDLTMDIYEANGDTATNRAVIIFMHPGAFFTGNNEVDDMVALSVTSAKKGYVAVSLSYRLGYNILSSYSAIRAVYRSVQDASAAIRYLREHHIDYGIDYDNIFIWGSSAGAFAGLHLSYIEDEDRLESTYGDGWADPDLGCIDCEGNNLTHYSKPNAVVSCWGAMLDINWIDEYDKIPLIMFHGSFDDVVPINSGYPFTIGFTLPFVFGSNVIHNKLNTFNIKNELYAEEGLPHEYWGASNGSWIDDGPNEYFSIIKDDAFAFLFDVIYPFELGDVNNDHSLDYFDVALLSSIITGNNNDSFVSYYADLNFDREIDIFDLTMLVDSAMFE
tara:strand:+ start:1160 stop:2329 length:1170 start_codon:yes stop_codon:yes gene_type:complete